MSTGVTAKIKVAPPSVLDNEITPPNVDVTLKSVAIPTVDVKEALQEITHVMGTPMRAGLAPEQLSVESVVGI